MMLNLMYSKGGASARSKKYSFIRSPLVRGRGSLSNSCHRLDRVVAASSVTFKRNRENRHHRLGIRQMNNGQ